MVDMMWDCYTKPVIDSKRLATCLDGVPVGQVAKLLDVIRDENLFAFWTRSGLWKDITEQGKSVAHVNRYQTGVLKVKTSAA
jgi:phage antirepressor YoqD-like protein